MSLAISGRDLVTRALKTLGITGQGETPSASDMQDGFDLLNEVVDSWAIRYLTIPTVDRQVYNLDGIKGGPSTPYTYGPGGDWDTGTAARPPYIQDANLLLNTSSPFVRIPLAILTTDMTAGTPIPNLTNPLPVTLYYNDTVPLGRVILWPVPTQTVNQIELFVPLVMPAFPDLSTLYVFPPGYLKAFRLNLAQVMIPSFAVPADVAGPIHVEASEALAQLENANFEMSDLSVDPAYTPMNHGTYVIQTDQGS